MEYVGLITTSSIPVVQFTVIVGTAARALRLHAAELLQQADRQEAALLSSPAAGHPELLQNYQTWLLSLSRSADEEDGVGGTLPLTARIRLAERLERVKTGDVLKQDDRRSIDVIVDQLRRHVKTSDFGLTVRSSAFTVPGVFERIDVVSGLVVVVPILYL